MARLSPFLLLAVLTALFFAELFLSRDRILYAEHSDFIANHLPLKVFMVRSWKQCGELPLWNPHWFAGTPFMQDLETAVFYPFHWLLLRLDHRDVGHALSWLIAFHVLIAGIGAFLYARHRGLRVAGSLVTAIGFMFSPKWLTMVLAGGFYMTIGVAWTPWMLLALEWSLARGSVPGAALAGAFGALHLLSGQPQWTLYLFVLAAVWTFPLARSLPRWVGLLAVMTVTTAALSAVQLLPTVEAIRQTDRGSLDLRVPFIEELSLSICSFLGLIGETLSLESPRSWEWELRTKLGVLWILAATLAPLLDRSSVIRRQAVLVVLLLGASILGGFLLTPLPVFGFFRNHARLILVLALPIAFLAGVAVDALVLGTLDPDARRSARTRLAVTSVAILILILLSLAYDRANGWSAHLPLYWAFAGLAAPILGWIAGTGRKSWHGPLLVLLLTVDAWLLTWPRVQTRTMEEIYLPSRCVDYLVKNLRPHERVLDYDLTGRMFYSPVGVALPLLQGFESLRGYDPLDVRGYRKFLAHVADPRGDWDARLLPNIPNLPLARPDLLNLLGVRYLVMPTDPALRGFAPASWVGEPPWLSAPPEPWKPVFTDVAPVAYDLTALSGIETFPPYTVYENPSPGPRAWIVSDAAALDDTSVAGLSEELLRRVVLLDPADVPARRTTPPAGSPGRVGLEEHGPDIQRIEVHDVEVPSFLVIADTWYPGWRCEVDGKPRPVLRANIAWRAVPLEKGDRMVVLRFEPVSLPIGRRITGLALVILGLLVLGQVLGLRYHESVVESEGSES